MEEQAHLVTLQIHRGIVKCMFSGWHAICQSRLGECYQRLILSLHFGNVILWFKQTVDIKKPGGTLSNSFLKSMICVAKKLYRVAVYLWHAVFQIFLSYQCSVKPLPTMECKRTVHRFRFQCVGYKEAEGRWCSWYFCRDFCMTVPVKFWIGTALWSGRYFTDRLNEFYFSHLLITWI